MNQVTARLISIDDIARCGIVADQNGVATMELNISGQPNSKKNSYQKLFFTLSMTLSTLCLTACAVQTPPNGLTTQKIADTLNKSAEQTQPVSQSQDVPSSVSNALLPEIQLHMNDQSQSIQTYDMVVNNAPADAFFQSLAKDTHDNLIVSPQVTGNISLNVHHMTLPQILMATHQIYGYRFEKTSYGYNIYPKAMMTKVFHVSYLNMERSGVSETSISSGSISSNTSSTSEGGSTESSTTNSTTPASTVTTKINNKFWEELKTGVAMIIGEDSSATTPISTTPAPATSTENPEAGAVAPPQVVTADTSASVLINPQAGIVIVKAYPDQLDRVAKYLRDVENIIDREVIINAKIIEVQLNSNFQSGVDWSVLGVSQNTTGSLSTDLPAMASNVGLNFSAYSGSLSAAVKLLSTQGRVNILSSPSIATVNNQKALIKIGSDDFYITGITSDTTSSSSTTTSESVDLNPFFSGIALDVTPEIDSNGDITLHIHPIISTVVSKPTTFNLGSTSSENLPLASSTIRESDNIVRAKNNQIILIGGMMEDKGSTHEGGTPFLSKIPLAGNLFKRQDHSGGKTEIVILLQPKLMNDDVTHELLQESAQKFSEMTGDFSFDTLLPNTEQKS